MRGQRSVRRALPAAAALAVLGSAAAVLPGSAPANSTRFSAHFHTISIRGATNLAVNGVNDGGVMLGTFETKGRNYEFIKGGRHLIKFDYPNASTATSPSMINDSGVAVGYYGNSNTSSTHGWIRFPNGKFEHINDPRAARGPGLGTVVLGVNDDGVIVGYYWDAGGSLHGFVDHHGKFRTVNVPGAGTAVFEGTAVTGINDSGEIVGYYTDQHEVTYGFVYRSGRFFKFSAPGAGSLGAQGTFPTGISRDGTILGSLITPHNRQEGWIRVGGRFFRLRDPHAAHGYVGTIPLGIDEDATLACGYYQDKTGAPHGWVAALSG